MNGNNAQLMIQRFVVETVKVSGAYAALVSGTSSPPPRCQTPHPACCPSWDSSC